MLRNLLFLTLFAASLLSACTASEEDLINRAISHIDAEEPLEALPYLDRAVKGYPESARAWNVRGIAHFEAANFQAAVEDFTQSIRIDSTGYKPFFNRANAYREMGRDFDAIQDYNIAIRFEPGLKDGYLNRGFMFFKTQVFGQAFEDFNQAVALDPTDVMAIYNRGRAALAIGEIAIAEQDFEEAIALSPDYALAHYWMGMVLIGREQKEEACARFLRAKNLGYDEAQAAIDDFCGEENG
jgi:tetratricopeptide (TPR) repeat protein